MTARVEAPRSALVIGVLGFCFGALGLIAGAQDIALQQLLSAQRAGAESCLSQPGNPDCGWKEPGLPGIDPGWSKEIGRHLSRPPWYPGYALVMGVVRALLGAGCMTASLLLILARPGADYRFMLVSGLSAARNLVAVGAAIAAGSLFSYWAVASGIVGFFIDMILVCLCKVSDRSLYRRPPA